MALGFASAEENDDVTPKLFVMVSLLAGCCPHGRFQNEGIIASAERGARGWQDRLPRCDDVPAPDGAVQVVGHINFSRGTWQSTLLGCEESRCCNFKSPDDFGVIERSTGGYVPIRALAPTVLMGPNPWFSGGRLDCEWEWWQRIVRRTTVRATGTMDGGAVRITALCKVP
jgi:hypothetical protein